MARVIIIKGGITTDVSKGELDWYLRNGWKIADEAQPEPETQPEAEPEDAPAEKKTSKKK